jgi:hypothetical protein
LLQRGRCYIRDDINMLPYALAERGRVYAEIVLTFFFSCFARAHITAYCTLQRRYQPVVSIKVATEDLPQFF